jgi:aspartyl aminopeptidase
VRAIAHGRASFCVLARPVNRLGRGKSPRSPAPRGRFEFPFQIEDLPRRRPDSPEPGGYGVAMPDLVQDLLAFIDRSPTPYHAVAECARRLEAAGFQRLAESDVWDHGPGTRGYVVRADGSIAAFEIGAQSPAETGFHLIGAHTDSPNLRLKPQPDVSAHGYTQLAVEPYGGVLLHTWLDRDLSLAGRVTLKGGDGIESVLVDFARPMLRIPNLAIHLIREIKEEGLKLNPQKHLVPVAGLEDLPALRELVATELRAQDIRDVGADDVLSFDLMTADTQPSSVIGTRGEFISAPRLDNLASAHAGVTALIRAGEKGAGPMTRMVVLYDHEEVGSRSAQGAAGSFLADTLGRIVDGFKGGEPQGLARAVSRSRLLSVDMAHAVHPNYADKHESGHQPVIGKGPVIKLNANQAYASDAETAGYFSGLCASVEVEPQHFVMRSDLVCGSTIGPITAARVGIRTVDVGNPMLAMHSCREMAGTADVEPMIDVLTAFYQSDAKS